MFLLLVFPASVLLTFMLLLILRFLRPPGNPTDAAERLHSRADMLVPQSQEGAEGSKRLERMLEAEEDLFKRGGK